MNKLICGMIVHNESSRYLERVIRNNLLFCDEVVVLDDHSTDGTADFCRKLGDRVLVHEAQETWDVEWRLREELMRHVLSRSPDYVIFIDADELFDSTMRMEMAFLMKRRTPAVAFRFFDMWNSEKYYRNDKYFHTFYGPRMCRADLLAERNWAEKRRHCGSLPVSALKDGITNARSRVRHLGYARPEDRQRKYEEKIADDPRNTFYSKDVYDEILNNHPVLYRFHPRSPLFLRLRLWVKSLTSR